MTKYLFFVLMLPLLIGGVMAQNQAPHQLFDAKGKKADFKKMMKEAINADVIFFGEYHNNAMAHWIQLQFMKELSLHYKPVTLAMEMFEADNQILLDEYLSGLISEARFEEEARLWNNYKTDYKPLVLEAKKQGWDVVATNIPRRYASMVSQKGLASLDLLSVEAKQWMMPLPVEVDTTLSTYQDMLGMMGGHGGKPNYNFLYAQAVKDATMAHFISENLTDKNRVYHINGSYHTKRDEGIIHFLKNLRPDISIMTITTVEQKDTGSLEKDHEGAANFILVVAQDAPKSY